jgi:alkanesulfonate monooxygenase SsuD/methylene tetrahydromethanopterin reductase-like flavin-dependent oxidoreductase (luciferase family)
MVYGSLADGVRAFREEAARHQRPPRRAMCSYFIHIASTPEEERYGREALVRYFQDALIAAFPADPKTVPPTLQYFLKIVELLKQMRPEALTNKSILVGPPGKIIADLKEVEQAGIAEVILYFNYGLKAHSLVKEQMQRFMEQVAPAFEGAHRSLRAEG